MLGALGRLKTVVRTGVGYDVIDVAAATELGVVDGGGQSGAVRRGEV